MSTKTFNGDQKIKLTQIINEGMQVMHEIDTLQGGLNDTIKAVAEELEVKPSIIKKAIKIAMKGDWDRVFHEFDDLETIVDISGHANLQEDLDKQNPNRTED
jgi:predicted regulator of amino acid metabolism with ACT domain